jgi:transposase
MPYKSDKKQLPELLDSRYRILPCQIERIKWLSENTELSYKKIAERFGVAKSTVFYIVHPDKYEEKLKKDRGRKKDKDKNKESVLRSRKKKHEFYKAAGNE